MPSAQIVIRTKDETTGKRNWKVATGRKDDPSGVYHIRILGQKPYPVYEKVEDNTWNASVAAQIKTERRLKANEIGAVLVDEPAPAPAPAVARHRLTDVTDSHIAEETKPDKNGGVRPVKSLKSLRSEMNAFIAWSKLTYVEELTQETLKGYRERAQMPKHRPQAVKVTYPVPENLHPNPLVNEVKRAMYQYRWERVEFEARQIERGTWKEPEKKPRPVFRDDYGNPIVPIDLKALAEQWRREHFLPSQPLPDIPASYNTGSSLADRVRVLTDEEWAALPR